MTSGSMSDTEHNSEEEMGAPSEVALKLMRMRPTHHKASQGEWLEESARFRWHPSNCNLYRQLVTSQS